MNDKQQLAAMGEHITDQASQPMCMAKQIEDLQARLQECAKGAAKMQEQRDQLAAQLKEARAEARKFKLAGLGMAVSIGEHVCIPEGWQLVPVGPTDHMTWVGQSMRYDPEISIGSIYCAMISAAPSPDSAK